MMMMKRSSMQMQSLPTARERPPDEGSPGRRSTLASIEAVHDEASPVGTMVSAWSTHLSDDDSDSEGAGSSRSQSQAEAEAAHGGGEDTIVAFNDSASDLADGDWLLDVEVDLPDTNTKASPLSVKHLVSRSHSFSSKHPKEEDVRPYFTPDEDVRPVEPSVSVNPPKPSRSVAHSSDSALKPPSSPSRMGSASSPPRSPPSSDRQPLLRSRSNSQLPSPKAIQRGQSFHTSQTSSIKTPTRRESQRPTANGVSTTSHFWASNQTNAKRSSRLLDEWKRKEIWHDFKRAEENVLTQPVSSHSSGIDTDGDTHPTHEIKPDEGRRLNDLLQTLRADITGTSSERRRSELVKPMSIDKSHMVQQPLMNSMHASVSRAEYNQVIQEKQRLLDEINSRERASALDQETVRSLNEKVAALENTDRENRYLKEEIQRHMMQDLTAKERIRTLEDQLALTARSEEQLKLQTRQLMQQNQTLQSDLLEKIAAETSKIQKMAHLSAEKQNLLDELQRQVAQSTQKSEQEQNQLRRTALRHMVGMLRRRQLRELFCTWRVTAQTTTRRWSQAVRTISNMSDRLDLKATVRAFGKLKAHAHEERQHEVALEVHKDIAVAQDRMRDSSLWAGLVTMKALVRKYALARQAAGFLRWRRVVESQRDQANRLVLAGTKMNAILATCRRVSLHRALLRWRWTSTLETHVLHYEKAEETEKSLVEAKDCVFALSRAKTRLEEKLQGARDDAQRMSNQLRENRTELQLVKHGYVTTVMRKVELQWLRAIFTEWRVQTELASCAKELQLQVEAAELMAMERDKYARSLDDYNKVLRNDLERFQFFSHDKRIAVDVLTKKLLREEEKLKQMEEQHVTLEEKVVAYKSQLTTLLEWKGTTLPSSLVGICKDVAVNHLYCLFMQHAAAGDSIDDPASVFPSKDPSDAAFRLPLDAFVLLLRGLGLLSNNARVELSELVRRNVPEYATSRGLNFADFVSTLNAVVNQLLQGGNDSQILNHVKAFWMQLLGRVALPPSVTSSERVTCDSASLHSTRSAWAGQLSEDILQNQEKLLAVLEHETAVVERAVMEKSSLKHTYSPTSEHSVSTVSAAHEYQCDPVAPLESQPHITGEFLSAGLDAYANWIQSGQVRDLFLAFRQPLQRVLGKFPDAANAGLSVPEVFTMLEDMRLFPSYLSRDLVQYHLGRLSGRDKRLSTSRLGELLGSCALELFAKSLPAANSTVLQLSAREILLSFFCDLGFLLESEIPAPPRICFVGMEVENILWPLFEYYAGNELHEASRSSVRVVMTLDGFIKFMTEIANAGPSAEGLFRRVLGETRRSNASSTNSTIMMLHFDEFYVAISYLQQERNPTTKYPSLGDAVKHWMQQTQ